MTEPDDLPPITEAMTATGAARAAEEALRQAAHASWDGVSRPPTSTPCSARWVTRFSSCRSCSTS